MNTEPNSTERLWFNIMDRLLYEERTLILGESTPLWDVFEENRLFEHIVDWKQHPYYSLNIKDRTLKGSDFPPQWEKLTQDAWRVVEKQFPRYIKTITTIMLLYT